MPEKISVIDENLGFYIHFLVADLVSDQIVVWKTALWALPEAHTWARDICVAHEKTRPDESRQGLILGWC